MNTQEELNKMGYYAQSSIDGIKICKLKSHKKVVELSESELEYNDSPEKTLNLIKQKL